MKNKQNLENITNKECKYYNYGGDGTNARPSYPTEYGARCEKYKEFFYMDKNKLVPNCYNCTKQYNLNK